MASSSVQHARPAHAERGGLRVRGWRGTGTRFEAGFDCGFDRLVRVTGSGRRCQRRLVGYLRQHRDLLAASAESRRSLQAALDDLSRWDRQQPWTCRVMIDDLPVTYWLRGERHPSD